MTQDGLRYDMNELVRVRDRFKFEFEFEVYIIGYLVPLPLTYVSNCWRVIVVQSQYSQLGCTDRLFRDGFLVGQAYAILDTQLFVHGGLCLCLFPVVLIININLDLDSLGDVEVAVDSC